MVDTGETVGVAEWIIDDTCLVLFVLLISKTIYYGDCKFFHGHEAANNLESHFK